MACFPSSMSGTDPMPGGESHAHTRAHTDTPTHNQKGIRGGTATGDAADTGRAVTTGTATGTGTNSRIGTDSSPTHDRDTTNTIAAPEPMADAEIERLDRAPLEALQLARLQETIRRVAASSPFYRQVFSDEHLTPDQFTHLDDIRKLPLITKEDLRAHYPDGFLAVPREEVVRLHTSTGTTGKPKAIFFTRGDVDRASDLIARCMAMTGAHPGDVFQNMVGYGLFTGGLIFHYGAEKLGLMVIPASAGNTERQLELLRDFGTTVVHLTPSYALYLADVLEQEGLDPQKDLKLRLAYIGAEPHSDETRTKVEAIYGIRAYNSYGLSEMNGPGVAFECPCQDGLHIWEDHYLVEIIDPDTGRPVPEGEEGELVLTSLTREAMPLLRYRTGDLTYIYPEPCPCGRTHRRLARMRGRVDDMFIYHGVNVFPSEIERVLMGMPGIGRNYQIVLTREGSRDVMQVRVEVERYLFDGSLPHLQQFQRQVQEKVKAACLVRPRIELLEAGSLPRTTGKATRVLDQRQV